jgi:RimJ/RimL family protein N-acetyltransferase
MSDWLLVRPAAPGDADALVRLGRLVAAEDELWLTYDRSPSDERRNVKNTRRDPNAAVFVAETPAGVVGRISIARDHNPYSHHVAELGLMVEATERRRGIGTGLMEEAEKWARASGVTKLELHVFPHNEPAIALYRKLGYEEEGHRRQHYRVAGAYVDAILMAKNLDSLTGELSRPAEPGSGPASRR